jgi:hypothetical protein
MDYGAYTKALGESLVRFLDEHPTSDVEVHFDPSRGRGAQIVSFWGDFSSATALSRLDLAIVHTVEQRALVLAEIEEEGARPKAIIGDVCSLLLADKIRIKSKDYDFSHAVFLFGIKTKERGSSLSKARNLQLRISQAIRSEFLRNIELRFVYSTERAELVSRLRDQVLSVLTLPQDGVASKN